MDRRPTRLEPRAIKYVITLWEGEGSATLGYLLRFPGLVSLGQGQEGKGWEGRVGAVTKDGRHISHF